jgi:putative oxidoreductase
MAEVTPDPQQTEVLPGPQQAVLAEGIPSELHFKDSAKDWALRGAFFVAFIYFATGKFKAAAEGPWVVLFKQIGLGQWFRYFTAVIEFIGAVLLLFSQTVELGLTLLIAVTLGATVIQIVVLHRVPDAFIPFAFMCAMVAFWMHRRRV